MQIKPGKARTHKRCHAQILYDYRVGARGFNLLKGLLYGGNFMLLYKGIDCYINARVIKMRILYGLRQRLRVEIDALARAPNALYPK